MITLRPSAQRGHAQHGWLDSHHTFSFGEYYDPQHMSFGALRVINEDRVSPATGFGTHPHRDMEIVTYVLEGELAHKDSMGNGSVIRPGDVQRMTAGTGVLHSENNPSPSNPVHFFQIWVEPEAKNLKPGYEQRAFPSLAERGLHLVGSRDGRDGSVTIHQDVALYAGKFASGEKAELALGDGRRAWIQVARGSINVNGTKLQAGDGASIVKEKSIAIEATDATEIIVFDLA